MKRTHNIISKHYGKTHPNIQWFMDPSNRGANIEHWKVPYVIIDKVILHHGAGHNAAGITDG